jgi:molybdate transport system ATP-binding protein
VAGTTLDVSVERRFRRGPTIAASFELDLAAARTLVLFGPSGSGKSTVLRCLVGLERPDRGRITAAGDVWFDAADRVDRPPQRRGVGYLPQGFGLFPHLDVRANIAYGITTGGAAERRTRVAELVAQLRLEGLERRRPGQLSGGQQQRVALARALARRPRLLVLDEPLSALDAPTREELRGELRQLLLAGGVPAIVVTHDRVEALVLGDRVAVMAEGSLRQQGPTLEVFDRPADETVARIVGIETVVPATVSWASEGLVRLRIGAAELVAVGDWPVGADVLVSIRAEDVIVVQETADPSGATLSARNRVRGRVVALEPAGPLVRVRIDCGFPLVAAVTRPALEDLALRPGSPVAAILKAQAVHVIG